MKRNKILFCEMNPVYSYPKPTLDQTSLGLSAWEIFEYANYF